MNDQVQEQPSNEVEQTAPQVEVPSMQKIEPKTFDPSQLEQASAYINEVMNICDQNGVEPVFNFDPSGELEEGYSLSVLPITERITGQGFIVKGVCVAALPTLETISAAPTGLAWINKQIMGLLVKTVKGAANKSSEDINSLPLSVNDFITSTRSSGLTAFNAMATLFIGILKQKSDRMKFLTKPIFRQILSSQAFADQQFPGITKDQWELVIKSMIAHAGKEGLEAGNLTHWLNTRNSIEVDTSEIDLSDLDEMVEAE